MGKKRNAKKSGSKVTGPVKLLPQTRTELSALVDEVFKRCTKVPSATAPNAAQEWAEYTEIFQLIQNIRNLEKDVLLPSYSREEQIPTFMSWLKEKGVKISGVEISDFDQQGFGLMTTEDLQQGVEVIDVPLEAMMTEDTARKSYLGPLIERDPILQHMGNVSLALHVLGEYVNPQSPWQPYLRILPASYSTTLYFSQEEILGLKGSPALEEAVRQFRNIARQYSYFYRILHSLPEARSWPIKDYFTFDAYRWAVSTIMTRQNRVPTKGASGQLALIPAWDMCNHEQGIYSTDYDEEKNCCVCLAQKDFKKGDQFTIYYGKRHNVELFLHNGFVEIGNENDSLAIKLGVSKNDPLHDEKVALLTSLGLPSSGSFMLIPGLHPISPGLLAFTRIFCMDKEIQDWMQEKPAVKPEVQEKISLDKWKDDGEKAKGLLHEDCDVGTTVQDKTWRFLHTRVSLLIRAYPTTLEEDQAALPTLKGNEAIIRSLLMCEKMILKDAMTYLSALLPK
ncbi:actin-histidine N-methyltransferase-like isoform X1 [Penaeus chinensis]|uniref:actin-histidine N-methyltransferase-like isoform X1 n=1 Tax=Penaeus chinensis TaxID=139456 RepID=UPI001FB5B2B7|nr:actin-histidine N-methyltransferase-like isoform X1 [Penaeus chinensis]